MQPLVSLNHHRQTAIMNLNLSDVYFSKHEISIYESLFSKLDFRNKGLIDHLVIKQLQCQLKLDSNADTQVWLWFRNYPLTLSFFRQIYTYMNTFQKSSSL